MQGALWCTERCCLGKMKIGQILHLKSQIRNTGLDYPALVQLEISDFGFEMQDSSNFTILLMRVEDRFWDSQVGRSSGPHSGDVARLNGPSFLQAR